MYDMVIRRGAKQYRPFLSRNILLAIIALFVVNCSENIKPTEKVVANNPWLQPFTAQYFDFQGIQQNIDWNLVSFSFKSRLEIDRFFQVVDSAAVENRWQVTEQNKEKRKYRRKSELYAAANHFDEVELFFDSKTDRIVLTSKPIEK